MTELTTEQRVLYYVLSSRELKVLPAWEPVSRKVSWSEPANDKHNFKKHWKISEFGNKLQPQQRWHLYQVHVKHDFPRRILLAEWFNERSRREKSLNGFLIRDEVGTYEFQPLHIANAMHEIPYNRILQRHNCLNKIRFVSQRQRRIKIYWTSVILLIRSYILQDMDNSLIRSVKSIVLKSNTIQYNTIQ